MGYVALTAVDLAIAATLLVANAVVSIAFNLGLERTLAIAAARMVAQLVLVGLLLKLIFQQTSPLWTFALAMVMILAAGHEAMARQEWRIRGWGARGLGLGTLLVVGMATTLFAVTAVVRPEPWHEGRYFLPLLGMILGNALTGVALALDTVTAMAHREKASVEARLALGASRFEALGEVVHRGLKTGMMPIVNSMAATGLVSLPGMMTGQILAGADPVEAAKYQIVIMFLLSGATAIGVVMATFGAAYLLTDGRHRLRLDRLERRRT